MFNYKGQLKEVPDDVLLDEAVSTINSNSEEMSLYSIQASFLNGVFDYIHLYIYIPKNRELNCNLTALT